MKNSTTPCGIETMGCRLVAQCLNQLRHIFYYLTQFIKLHVFFFRTINIIRSSDRGKVCYCVKPGTNSSYLQPETLATSRGVVRVFTPANELH